MIIDFATITTAKRYSLMSNTIFPRPIAWISTEDNGVINIDPATLFRTQK